jgi:hypothetical protein
VENVTSSDQLFTIIFRTCRLLPIFLSILLLMNISGDGQAAEHAGERCVQIEISFWTRRFLCLPRAANRLLLMGKRQRETPACLLLAGGVAHLPEIDRSQKTLGAG